MDNYSQSGGFSLELWESLAAFSGNDSHFDLRKRSRSLDGGWTNPIEKYARQIGSFPQGSGWK